MGEKGGKDRGGKGLKGGKGGVAGGTGPAGGCWHCGGDYYVSECPRGGGKTFQLSEWFPPEWSGGTTELAKSVVAIERLPREGPGGARGQRTTSWEEVELAVDSGATETVISPDILEDVELRQGAPYERGVEYEVANCVQIHNLVYRSHSRRINEVCGSTGLRCQSWFAQCEEDYQIWEPSCF